MKLTFQLILSSVLIILVIGGCETKPPSLPDMATVQWTDYVHPTLGYHLDYPTTFVADAQGDDVVFRYRNSPIFRVVFVTEVEANHRGLWADHRPLEELEIGGQPGWKYSYEHYDGPFYEHTVAYVIEYEDRLLGLEFRTPEDSLNALEQHMLDSFHVK